MATAISKLIGGSAAGWLNAAGTGVLINVYSEIKNGVFVPGYVVVADVASGKHVTGGSTGVTFPEPGHAVVSCAGVEPAPWVGTIDLWEAGNTNQGDAAVSVPGISVGRTKVLQGYVNVVG